MPIGSSVIRLDAFSYADVNVFIPGAGQVCVNGIVSISGFGNTVERGEQRGLGSQLQGYTTGLITPNPITIEMQAGSWDLLKTSNAYPLMLTGASKVTWTFSLFKLGVALPITLIAADCTFMSDTQDMPAGSDQIVVSTVWNPLKAGRASDLAALALI